MTKINLIQLSREIRTMSRQNVLYKVLKRELTRLGYWRNRPRGNPVKGYKVMRERKG